MSDGGTCTRVLAYLNPNCESAKYDTSFDAIEYTHKLVPIPNVTIQTLNVRRSSFHENDELTHVNPALGQLRPNRALQPVTEVGEDGVIPEITLVEEGARHDAEFVPYQPVRCVIYVRRVIVRLEGERRRRGGREWDAPEERLRSEDDDGFLYR